MMASTGQGKVLFSLVIHIPELKIFDNFGQANI